MKIADIINALRGARSELSSLRSRLKTLEKRREDLEALPLPKPELAELLDRMIDEAASVYPERLARSLAEYAQNPMQKRAPLNHDDGSGNGIRVCTATDYPQIMATPKTVERALCFLLSNQLKAGVRRAIDEMPYSAHVGPPMQERRRELAKVESEISDLKEQIKVMEKELQEGGVG